MNDPWKYVTRYELREWLKFKGQSGGLAQTFYATRTLPHLDFVQAVAKESKELAEKSNMEYSYTISEIKVIEDLCLTS